MTNHLKPDPSKATIQAMIKRNDLSEMMECHIKHGLGSPTLMNFNWHVKSWIQANIDSTTTNVHTAWWSKRIMLLDAILKHPNYKDNLIEKSVNLPCVTMQLKEVN